MDTFIKIYIPVYMVAFSVMAMVMPSYKLYKRTGINPVTFSKKADTAHDYIGVMFKLIFVVIAIYGLMNSFIVFAPLNYLDKPILKIIGIALSLASLIFILSAQKTMADSWRIGIDDKNKTKLIKNGAFKYSRNPIFLGMILVLVGVTLILATYFIIYLTVLSYIIISIQVRLEEEYLSKVHGKEYIEYKKMVGRFIPKVHKIE